MANPYDNRGETDATGAQHLAFTIGEKRFLYCYIRKNACTSMKHLMCHAIEMQDYDWGTPFPFHKLCCRPRSGMQLADFDAIFFIYRDPVDRLVSLFNSKFVHRSAHSDIARNYEHLTSLPFSEATFETFVFDYVVPYREMIDPHCRSQNSHLAQIRYSHAIELSLLADEMSGLVGRELSQLVFSSRVNSTAKLRYHESAHHIPCRRLHQRYRDEGSIPSKAALVRSESYDAIADRFRDDFLLMRRLAAGGHASAPDDNELDLRVTAAKLELDR